MEDKYYELAKELGIIDDEEKCSYGECDNRPKYPEEQMTISGLKENILLLVEELQIKQKTIKDFSNRCQRQNERIETLEYYLHNYEDRISVLQKIIDELQIKLLYENAKKNPKAKELPIEVLNDDK